MEILLSDFFLFFFCVVRCNKSLLYVEGVCLIVAVSLVQCPGWTFKAMSTQDIALKNLILTSVVLAFMKTP